MEHPDSPRRPRQRRRIELQQEQDYEQAVVLAGDGNHHNVTTIYDLNEDLLRLSQTLLGIGHFRYVL
jgi:hypothetical protein